MTRPAMGLSFQLQFQLKQRALYFVDHSNRYALCMGHYLTIWNSDIAANRSSAKGRLIVTLFRLGQALPGRLRSLYHPIYYFLVDVLIGVSLPLQATIGGGLILRHGQGIVISWKSQIGDRCEIHQHVTLGEKNNRAPTIGDDVTIGANAVVLGDVTVGDGAMIGAGAVVLHDVPKNFVAVGNPARIFSRGMG